MDVIALEHRLKLLQNELDTMKKNVVSQGELTLLKAQTMTKIAENQITQRTHLIDDYVETMRRTRAAEATIAVLEQKIKEETDRRSCILEESSSVLSSLDLSDLSFKTPKVTGIDPNFDPSGKFELERVASHLQETHNTISSLENTRSSLPLQANVAKEMNKSFEREFCLKSIGTSSIRQEIQVNQKVIAELESIIRKMEVEYQKERDNFKQRKETMENEVVEYESQLSIASESFNQHLSQLDNEANNLKTRITDSVLIFDKIAEETRLLTIEMQQNKTEDFEEIEEDEKEYTEYNTKSEFSYNYESVQYSSINDDPEVLEAKKKELIEEISEINDKIKDMKKKGLKRETIMKEEITALNERYKANKAILVQNNVSMERSSSSSGISKNLEMLISKIDDSLNELKSDLK